MELKIEEYIFPNGERDLTRTLLAKGKPKEKQHWYLSQG